MLLIDRDWIRVEIILGSWRWYWLLIKGLFAKPRPMTEAERQAFAQTLANNYLESIVKFLNHQTMLAEILKVESEEPREKLDTVRINYGKAKE